MAKKYLKRLKIFLSTFVTALGLFVLIPTIVPIVESHHNCSHDECAICEVIRVSNETKKQEIILDNPNIEVEERAICGNTEYVLLSAQTSFFDTLIILKDKISS